MYFGNYGDVQDAFMLLMKALMTRGWEEEVRGAKTKEFAPAQFGILNPLHRVSIIKGRNINPFAQIAETLWVLAGRNDLDWLERYIPQCKRWSDDGKTWRAGYGPRLRTWKTFFWRDEQPGIGWMSYETDQIANVVDLLKRDPQTRQAVISLWDPAQDWVVSKDIPCNNWLHFIIRNGQLHLNVSVRSNDIWFGFSHVDFFCWSVLLQMMAFWVGADVGKIFWNATSLHIYEKHWDKEESLSAFPTYDYATNPRFWTSFEIFDEALQTFFTIEEHARESRWNDAIDDSDPDACEFLHICTEMIIAYNMYLNKSTDDWLVDLVRQVHFIRSHPTPYRPKHPRLDFQVAAVEFFMRKIPEFAGECARQGLLLDVVELFLP